MANTFHFIQTASALPKKNVGKRNLIQEIIDIFTDPFFLLMAGIFEEPPVQQVSVFDKAPPQYLSYRSVKAQQANGDIVDFWVKFDYKKAAISVISWMPDINKFK